MKTRALLTRHKIVFLASSNCEYSLSRYACLARLTLVIWTDATDGRTHILFHDRGILLAEIRHRPGGFSCEIIGRLHGVSLVGEKSP